MFMNVSTTIKTLAVTAIMTVAVPFAATAQTTDISEDFSLFTEGSEDSPSAAINSENGNIPARYFHTTGWSGYGVHQAGGACALINPDQYGAQLNTVVGTYSGAYVVKVRAKTLSSNYQDNTRLNIGLWEEAENQYNQTTYYENFVTTKSEWREFTFKFDNNFIYANSNRMLVSFYTDGKVLIDDVRVQQVDQNVETPHLLPHRAYTGNSFKPAWNKVEGADKYLVNVYNSDLEGNIGDILVENMETADTTCTVRGLLPGNIYRYNVTAVSGDRMSLPTNNAELYDLVTPVLDPVESVEDGKFTATWNKVPNALYYNYYVYEEKPVTEDGDVTVIDENFDNVTDWGGGSFGWTADQQPTYPNEQELGYLANVNQTGFTATCWAPLQAGYVALDGWNYFYDVVKNVRDVDFVTYDIKKYAKLETPEFDLSKDEGRMHISVDLWGTYAEDNLDKENNYPAYQVNAIVALCNYDFTLGGYVEAETKHCVLSEAWNTFTADFTKGTENSKIVIYATDGPGFLFVDNLKLTQRYEKGESLSRPVVFNPGLVQPKVDVTLPEGYQTNNYYQRAQAVSQRDVYLATRQYTFYSRLSDPDEVYAAPTAIKDVTADSVVKASVEGDNIVVVGTAGEQVTLHTASGACVAAVKSAANSVSFNVPNHGVYIVKVGTKTLKLTK